MGEGGGERWGRWMLSVGVQRALGGLAVAAHLLHLALGGKTGEEACLVEIVLNGWREALGACNGLL